MGVKTESKVEKKSKCVKCDRSERDDYQSAHGTLFGFLVEFENGDKGIYKAKDPNNPKFKIGEECDYILEKVVSDDPSKTWVIYNIKSVGKKDGFGGGYTKKKKTPEEQTSIFKQIVLTLSIEAERELLKAKIESPNFTELRKSWLVLLIKKSIINNTTDETLGITSSSAIKITVGYAVNECLTSNTNTPLVDISQRFEQIFNYILPKQN